MRTRTILLATIPLLRPVLCRHNVTIDDQDPSIQYNPRASWALSANSSLNVGGAHMLTQDLSATATFTFTGVEIYFMSPKWPYTVTTAVSLDAGPVSLLDLVDHSRPNVGQGSETVQSQVIWGSGELPNRQHTLVISVGTGQPFAVIDALVYTALDPADLTTSESSATTTTTTTTPPTSSTQTSTSTSSSTFSNSASVATESASVNASSNSSHTLPIALGTVFGVLALLLVLLGIWFCYRRRKRPSSEAWTVAGTRSGSSAANGPGRSVYETSDYSYTGVSQPYDNSWERGPAGMGPVPGAMSPATAAALAHPYANATPVDDGWQGTTAQIAQRYMRSPNRYQPNTLSTITETSTPQGTPLNSNTGELMTENTGATTIPVQEPPFPVLRTDRSAYSRPPKYS